MIFCATPSTDLRDLRRHHYHVDAARARDVIPAIERGALLHGLERECWMIEDARGCRITRPAPERLRANP